MAFGRRAFVLKPMKRPGVIDEATILGWFKAMHPGASGEVPSLRLATKALEALHAHLEDASADEVFAVMMLALRHDQSDGNQILRTCAQFSHHLPLDDVIRLAAPLSTHPDPLHRLAAAGALARPLDDDEPTEPSHLALVARLLTDEDARVVSMALSQMSGWSSHYAPLIERATPMLQHHADKEVRSLFNAWRHNRITAGRGRLVADDEPAVEEPLVDITPEGFKPWRPKRGGAQAGDSGAAAEEVSIFDNPNAPEIVARLTDAFASADPERIHLATIELAHSAEPSTPAIRNGLAKAMTSEAYIVRAMAIQALALRQDQRVVPHVLHHLTGLPEQGSPTWVLMLNPIIAMPDARYIPALEAIDVGHPDHLELGQALDACREVASQGGGFRSVLRRWF